ncbi:glycosyltransferase family 2 protein [Nocardioides alcanivorans]|uniref:glycosyltransferase family 2 protein n=1 Tax=Nocardioides alcanivorans TaxID=2897352 RepID=UPI001F41BF41|nr:glycosyltransferase family 2 protein [Nocardioides alcanivorans]
MPDFLDLSRRFAKRLVQSGPGRRLRRPRLSIIVPFYNVEAYLADCLDSILAQSFWDFEVLLVDDGSPDGSRAIAEQYVARDPRVLLLTRPNGGLGAARNTGVRASRGSHLTFVDSDDLLPAGALRSLMTQATESGSDIVVGSVERFDSRRRWRPTWVPNVHTHARAGITIDEFLPLLRNLYTWNKVFRRDFWEAQDLWFREGVAYEDQPIITQLFARAKSIDVLPDVVYEYRARDDKSSISQQTASLKDLRARIEAWRLSEEAFRTELSERGYQGWLATLFDAHLQWYLASPGTSDDTYWAEIVAAVRHYSDQAEQWVWDATEPAQRVLVELARQDRRADAQELVRRQHVKPQLWPSEVRDDGILLQLPLHDDPQLPDDLFLLRPDQMTIRHALENLRWAETDGRVWGELSGSAAILKLDLARFDAQISVVLRNERTGAELVHESIEQPRASSPIATDDLWCDYSPGTFRVRFPVDELSDQSLDGDRWSVSLRIAAGKFLVTEPVTKVLRSGAAGYVPGAIIGNGRRILSDWRFAQPLSFRIDDHGVQVTDVSIEGRLIRATLPAGHGIRAVEVSHRDLSATARVDGGRFSIELPQGPPLGPGDDREWRVQVKGDPRRKLVLAPGRCRRRGQATRSWSGATETAG